ncbi:hypothetical protein AAFF_G00076000 [Aldrovandia affinis]|uniref:Uncharacterized protein n=1 Tax=Aldrovandia affinis TaxID=143900 RepID=A0AAD7WDD7_9TELE|nr:hypothetical protein AAFF_G00076000 [Aldrovandia affinis]
MCSAVCSASPDQRLAPGSADGHAGYSAAVAQCWSILRPFLAPVLPMGRTQGDLPLTSSPLAALSGLPWQHKKPCFGNAQAEKQPGPEACTTHQCFGVLCRAGLSGHDKTPKVASYEGLAARVGRPGFYLLFSWDMILT